MGRMVLVAMAMVAFGAVRADALVLCAKAKGGTLKEGSPLKVRTACNAKEVQVDPDAAGLRGPAGTNGADGTPGAPGSPGLSGIEIVTEQGNTVPDTTPGTSTTTPSCPAGKKVLGGGYDFEFPFGSGAFTTAPSGAVSRPVTTSPQGWSASAEAAASDDWRIVGYVICANATP